MATVTCMVTTQAVNAQTGTSYTVLTSDTDKLVTLDNAAAISVNVDAIPIGETVYFMTLNAGQATFAVTSGAIQPDGATVKSARQYARIAAQRITSTLVSLYGSLAAS